MVDSHYELQCGAESLPEQTFGFDSVLQDSCARDISVLTVYKHTSTAGKPIRRSWRHLLKRIIFCYKNRVLWFLFEIYTFLYSTGNRNMNNITI